MYCPKCTSAMWELTLGNICVGVYSCINCDTLWRIGKITDREEENEGVGE